MSADLPVLMPPEDIEACLAVFARRRPGLVVEWGGGGSTLRFSGLDSIERWHTIEHDLAWVDELAGRVSRTVTVHHVGLESDEYVTLPQPQGLRPDLVLIDGRRRVECLRLAREILAPDGVVLLHDSARRRYAEGADLYPVQQVLTPGAGLERRVDTVETDGLFWHQGVTVLSLGELCS
jgi:hypothetical protein